MPVQGERPQRLIAGTAPQRLPCYLGFSSVPRKNSPLLPVEKISRDKNLVEKLSSLLSWKKSRRYCRGKTRGKDLVVTIVENSRGKTSRRYYRGKNLVVWKKFRRYYRGKDLVVIIVEKISSLLSWKKSRRYYRGSNLVVIIVEKISSLLSWKKISSLLS